MYNDANLIGSRKLGLNIWISDSSFQELVVLPSRPSARTGTGAQLKGMSKHSAGQTDSSVGSRKKSRRTVGVQSVGEPSDQPLSQLSNEQASHQNESSVLSGTPAKSSDPTTHQFDD